MVFGAFGVMGFGGNERGRLFGLAPRHPLYLVSLRANSLAQPGPTEWVATPGTSPSSCL